MSDPCDSSRSQAQICVDVEQHAGDWAWLGAWEDVIAHASEHVAAAAVPPGVQLAAALALADDAVVRSLNRDWRRQDKPTNVLSFPAPKPPRDFDGPTPIGDIVIAEETLLDEARTAGIEPAHHFQHLLVHGLLHLLGHDHEDDEEAAAMEALETRILAALGIPDPYADTEPVRADHH